MGMSGIEGNEHIKLPLLQMSEAVLPADYPLFDWADWPESRAALVPGGPTRKFERACWNAIVATISQAAYAAGFDKHNLYIGTMSDIEGGWLAAEKMNSLVDAFDRFLPMGWFWRSDRFGTFEKKEFRGHPGWGFLDQTADVLYPEYILGLASRVNLYIQLMRDNYPHAIGSTASPYLAVSRIQSGAKLGGQARMDAALLSQLQISRTAAEIGYSRRFSAQAIARVTLADFPVETHPAIRGYMPDVVSCLQVKLSGRSFLGTQPQIEPVASGVLVHMEDIQLTRGHRETEAWHQAYASIRRTVSRMAPSVVLAQQRSRSCCRNSAAVTDPLPVAVTYAAGTTVHPGAQPGEMLRLQLDVCSGTSQDLAIVKPPILLNWADEKSAVSVEAVVDQEPAGCVRSHCSGKASVVCSLGTAWEPPTWVNGGLWIRQVQTKRIRSDGSLDLSGTGDPVSTSQSSRSKIVVAIGTAWEPPVWYDGGLYIRQVRNPEVLEDGSINLTGMGEELLVRQRSRTKIGCTLESAWYPPEWVNDGLHIRQAQAVLQNEKK